MPFLFPSYLAAAAQTLSLAILAAGVALFLQFLRQGWRSAQSQHMLAAAIGRLQARPWQPLDAAVLVLAILLPALWNGLSSHADDPADISIAAALLYYAILLGLVVAAARRTGLGLGRALGLTAASLWPALRTGLVLGLAALPPVLLVAWSSEWLLEHLGLPFSRQAVFDTLSDPSLSTFTQITLIFLAVVVAPLAEEAIFRGVIFPAALRQGRLVASLLLVNILFALLHLHAPSFLPLLTIGICLSLGMLATGSLVTPIVMHAIFNGEMLLLFYAWPALAS